MKFLKNLAANFLLFFHTLQGDVKKYLPIVLHITQAILKLISSGVVDTVIGIIDPTIKAEIPEIETILKKAIATMLGIENAEGETLDQLAHDFISWLSTQHYIVINAMIIKLASTLLSLLDGGKQTEVEYDTLVQSAVHTGMHKLETPTAPVVSDAAGTTATNGL